MDLQIIILLIAILLILHKFAKTDVFGNFYQKIDNWLTLKYGLKRFEKKANKLGFIDLFQKEITLHPKKELTQLRCHNAFRSAYYKHKNII